MEQRGKKAKIKNKKAKIWSRKETREQRADEEIPQRANFRQVVGNCSGIVYSWFFGVK